MNRNRTFTAILSTIVLMSGCTGQGGSPVEPNFLSAAPARGDLIGETLVTVLDVVNERESNEDETRTNQCFFNEPFYIRAATHVKSKDKSYSNGSQRHETTTRTNGTGETVAEDPITGEPLAKYALQEVLRDKVYESSQSGVVSFVQEERRHYLRQGEVSTGPGGNYPEDLYEVVYLKYTFDSNTGLVDVKKERSEFECR